MDKKIPWPYDEFAGETTAPEHEILFREIAGELAFRRKVKMSENDRLLRDYRAAWTGMKDSEDGSVLDPPIPQSYIDEWFRMTGPQSTYGQKQVKEYSASIGSVSVTASDVACSIQQAAATIRLGNPAEVRALGQALLAAASQMTAAPEPLATGAGGKTSNNRVLSQNEKVTFGNPVLEERKRQNEIEMEKYAQQSGMTYPKWQ